MYNCSRASFVTTELVKKLNVSGTETSLAIKTISGTETVKSDAIEDLIIKGINTQFEVDLPIGANCAKALEPVDGGPYAYRTILG